MVQLLFHWFSDNYMKADEDKCDAAQIQSNNNKKLKGVKDDFKLSLNRDLKVDGCQSKLHVILK